MSYFRRGYSWEEIQYLPAPTGGWNPDAPPNELPDTQAPVLDNVIINPGQVSARGPVNNWANLATLTGANPVGVCGVQPIPYKTSLLIGRKVTGGTPAAGAIDPQFAPIVRPTTAAALAAGVTTVWTSTGGAAGSSNVLTADQIPGARGVSFQGLRYYISYDSAAAAVHAVDANGYFMKPLSLVTLPTGGAASVATLTLAPHAAIDVKAYQSRIWLFGGIDTPGAKTVFEPNTVYYTIPGDPGVGAASADWRDPVAGTTQRLTLDGNMEDPLVGGATVRGALVAFRYSSLYALRGTSNANYTWVPISREIGAFDARSIVECDQGAYFISKRGLMLTDGTAVRNVTGQAMMNTFQNAAAVTLGSIVAGWGGYATIALTSDGQLLVSMGAAGITAGVLDNHIVPVWSGLFDPKSGTWVRITSALWATDGVQNVSGNNYPGWVMTTPDKRLLAVGDKYVTQLESDQVVPATLVNSKLDANAGTVVEDTSIGVIAFSSLGPHTRFTAGNVSVSQLATQGTNANDASIGVNDWTFGPGLTQMGCSSGAPSHYAKQTNFGFTIPADAVITGVLTYPYLQGFAGTKDASVKLVKGGVISGTDHADPALWPSGALRTYGGNNDLWGLTLTPADVNSSGFGVAHAVTNGGSLLGTSVTVCSTRVTHYDKATNFGFAIPTTATVFGVSSIVTGQDFYVASGDSSVKLVKGGVISGTNHVQGYTYTATATPYSYGSTSDLWGLALAPADVNSSGFGIAVALQGRPAGTAGSGGSTGFPTATITSLTIAYGVLTASLAQTFVQRGALYDKDAAGLFQAIPVQWVTKLAPMAVGGRKRASLKRYFVDYMFQELGPQSGSGWTIQPIDESGNALRGPTRVVTAASALESGSVSGGVLLPTAGVQRLSQDDPFEAIDMAFIVTFSDTPNRSSSDGLAIADLFGIGVELQRSGDM